MKRALVNIKDCGGTSSKKSKNEDLKDCPYAKCWKGSDALLIVEGKELHVHSQTLSLASPVFEQMFNGHFLEGKTRRATLEGKSFELVEHMLNLIYPNEFESLGNYTLLFV